MSARYVDTAARRALNDIQRQVYWAKKEDGAVSARHLARLDVIAKQTKWLQEHLKELRG